MYDKTTLFYFCILLENGLHVAEIFRRYLQNKDIIKPKAFYWIIKVLLEESGIRSVDRQYPTVNGDVRVCNYHINVNKLSMYSKPTQMFYEYNHHIMVVFNTAFVYAIWCSYSSLDKIVAGGI
eukprot:snap_masked-scaffold_7-processed-gene-7.31-mRNA-1 protein AED:1.00 eAED:1.00 QI:0/0/0/0/1/1/2/0/122